MALLLFGWVFLNRKHPILRRKSPLFLSFILLGVILILIAGILLAIGLKDSTLCILHAFALVWGLTLIVSSLMAKNWRIYRIFNNPKALALYISDRYIIAFPAVMSLVSLGLLFTYAFAGGTLNLEQFVADQNSFYVFELCASPASWSQVFMVIFFYAYFLTLFAFTASLAMLTRHAHNSFRESKTIASIIYMYFCMGIIFIPLYYVQGQSTDSQATRFVIQSLNICILMIATKAVIFIPELVAVNRYNRRQERGRVQRN